jgi:hypothetical protein
MRTPNTHRFYDEFFGPYAGETDVLRRVFRGNSA